MKKKMVIGLAVVFMVSTSIGTAFAAGSAMDLYKWKTTGYCQNCDLKCDSQSAPIPIPDVAIDKVKGLTGTQMSDCSFEDGLSLAEVDLSNAVLDGADLRGVSLEGATIDGTSFHKTKFGKNSKNKINNNASNLHNMKNEKSAAYWKSAELINADKPDTFPGKSDLSLAKWSKGKNCEENSNNGKCNHTKCNPKYVLADGTCAQ